MSEITAAFDVAFTAAASINELASFRDVDRYQYFNSCRLMFIRFISPPLSFYFLSLHAIMPLPRGTVMMPRRRSYRG